MKPRIFKLAPMYGKVIDRSGQKYTLKESVRKNRRSDGNEYTQLTWSSHCADCDSVFETKSTLTITYLNRRCKKHRAPGKRVTKKTTKRKTNR